MIRFKDISIKIKMATLALVPLLGLLYFSSALIEQSYDDNHNMRSIKKIVHFTTSMSALVHALQSERSVSTGYLASDTKKFSRELNIQRGDVDEKLIDFKEIVESLNIRSYSKKFRTKIERTLNQLTQLNSIRQEINKGSITLTDTLDYYMAVNGAFLSSIAEVAKISTDARISMELNGYSAYALAKEKAAAQEATLNYVFIKNAYPKNIKDRVITLKAQEDRYMNSFIKRADDSNVKFYEQKIGSSDVSAANNLYNLATSKSRKFGINSAKAFDILQAKINILKDIDEHLVSYLSTEATKKMQLASTKYYTYLTVNIIVVFLTLIIAIFVSRDIIKSLHNFRNGLKSFFSFIRRETEISTLIDIDSKDEFGILANMVNENLKEIKEELQNDMLCTGEAVSVLAKAQAGYMDTRVEATTQNPQINTLIDSINNLMEKFEEQIGKDITKVLENISEGNLSARIENEYEGLFLELKNSTNNIAQTIEELFKESGEALNSLSQGDLSTRIHGHYAGDFSIVKSLKQHTKQ